MWQLLMGWQGQALNLGGMAVSLSMGGDHSLAILV